ncbi:MAG: hypothetical protein ACTSX6_02545 [Candidatus Heimdallarchaeaceae archaeon]
MKMQKKIHFYYGNKLSAFQIGLGTIIRAKGHNLNIYALIFSLDNEIHEFSESKLTIPFEVVSLKETEQEIRKKLEFLKTFENSVLLIANVDFLVKKNIISFEILSNFITELNRKNEIILTSEKEIEGFINIADYVSLISITS